MSETKFTPKNRLLKSKFAVEPHSVRGEFFLIIDNPSCPEPDIYWLKRRQLTELQNKIVNALAYSAPSNAAQISAASIQELIAKHEGNGKRK